MSFDQEKRKKSGGIVDRVYGQDTEAFLDDLLSDDILDWSSGEQNENTGETSKQQTNKQNLEHLLTAEDKSTEPAEPVTKRGKNEAAKSEEPATYKEKSARPNLGRSTTPASPKKRWTRFPKRVPTPPDLVDQNSSQNTNSSVEHSSAIKDSDTFSIDTDISDVSDLLRQMEFPHDAWEDEQDSNFEVRQKKMENYLEHLRREDQRKMERRMGEPFRRNSVSSVGSSTTSSSSSSSLDMKYASACTVEELIDCKMKDVEDKFNDNIRDTWTDDVELALMLVKKKSRRKDLRNNEAKELLNSILEQK